MSLWQRVDVLVPEPNCDIVDEVITTWRDARPQPNEADLQTVTQGQIDARDPVLKREAAEDFLKVKKPVYTPQEIKERFDAIELILGI